MNSKFSISGFLLGGTSFVLMASFFLAYFGFILSPFGFVLSLVNLVTGIKKSNKTNVNKQVVFSLIGLLLSSYVLWAAINVLIFGAHWGD